MGQDKYVPKTHKHTQKQNNTNWNEISTRTVDDH